MSTPQLTPEQYAHFAHSVGSRVAEFFDGFAVVGFHATTGQPVIYTYAADIKTRMAMTNLLQIATINNGSPCGPPPDPNEQPKS